MLHMNTKLYLICMIKKRLLKSMKFLEEPSHRILQDQIEVLNDNILQIIKHPKHLDLIFKNVD